MKNLFGGSPLNPVEQDSEDIQWEKYIRMVQLFFDERQHAEFKQCMAKLSVRYGTKNDTETVLRSVRELVMPRLSEVCQDCDGTKDICSNPGGCPKHANPSAR